MRYIGIDYGTKRIGVAVSDEIGRMAFPKSVYPNDGSFLSTLGTLIEECAADEIVIGHSLDRQANPNQLQEAIEALVTDITLQWGLPVHLEPEQYTTQAALRIQGRNEQTDASAAALILDSFLQKINRNYT